MRLLIISDAPTLKKEDKLYSYAPYVNEINLWTKNFDKVKILSPTKYNKRLLLNSFEENIEVSSIPAISLISISEVFKSILYTPYIILKLFINMFKASHIHLRNPGSIGLLACLVQILFPFKTKTSKYAGNWDPESKQPYSYRVQKWILSNTFLTRNIKVLVYGEWENQSKNILPFFTASYRESETENIPIKSLSTKIKFIFVGTFSKGKQPLLSIKTIELLNSKKHNVQLDMYGNGVEFNAAKKYIIDNNLSDFVVLHGNQPKEIIKKAYQKAHFLLFISKSEGWPKVVAEAMFWGCLPISSKVSCVSSMLDNGNRGEVLNVNITISELYEIVVNFINNPEDYQSKAIKAQEWSQKYTLDKFELEIKKLLND